jgi:hypothetical protein
MVPQDSPEKVTYGISNRSQKRVRTIPEIIVGKLLMVPQDSPEKITYVPLRMR